jgi:hypothetical protein
MTGETPTPPDLTDGKVNRIAAVSKRPLPAMFLRATKSPSSRVRALSRSSWTTPSVTSVKSVVSPGSPQSIDPLVLLRGLDSWFLGIPRLRRGRFCQTNPFSINKDGPFAKKRTHFEGHIRRPASRFNRPRSCLPPRSAATFGGRLPAASRRTFSGTWGLVLGYSPRALP